MISATTTGYGDIVPVTDNTRLFDALIVTPIRILFLLVFIGTAYLFVARRTWEKFVMKRIQRSLRDHIVVVGYGTKNSRAVQELIDLGAEPETIVVIDQNRGPDRVRQGDRLHGPQGRRDPRRDADRGAHRAGQAGHHLRRPRRYVDPGLPDRPLPGARMCGSAWRSTSRTMRARRERAGADVVVNPLDFAGLLLATTHAGHHIADYLADLATMGGRVRLVEREVRPEEIGTALKDLSPGPGPPDHPRRHALWLLAAAGAEAGAGRHHHGNRPDRLRGN